MKTCTVLIVDDHTLVAQACATALNVAGIDVIAVTDDLQKAVDLVRVKRPDIVLLDINLPGGSGLDLIAPFHKFSPISRVIGFSMHAQPAFARKMIRLGAKGYLAKNSSMDELTEAILCVQSGGVYLSPRMREKMVFESIDAEFEGSGSEKLSIREIEVLKLIQDGMFSKEIAETCSISLKTVEVHRHNILKKLKVKNMTSAIARYKTDVC